MQGRKKRSTRLRYRQVPAVAVLAVMIVIIAVFSVINIGLNQNINKLQGMVEEGSDLVALKQKEASELADKLKLAATDEFIASEARTRYGYLAPGEIRFVVTNPEVLWGEEGPPPEFAPKQP